MEIIKKVFKQSHIFLLVLILLGGFLVRLYKIGNPLGDWHSWRQADTASVSRIFFDEGINLFKPRYYDISNVQTGVFNPEGLRLVELPIYNALHSFLAKNITFCPAFEVDLQNPVSRRLTNFFGLTVEEKNGFLNCFEVWGRGISISAALLTTYLIYLIARKFTGVGGALFSSFFYAFLPFNVYFTRVILPEPLSVFFTIFSLWLFIKYLEKEKKAILFLSAFIFSLAMLLKPFVIFYGLGFVFLAWKKYGFKAMFKKTDLFIALDIALLPFFIWRIWINKYPWGIPFFEWAFNGDKIRFKPAFWRWIFGERLGYLILGIWGLVPFIFGILRKNANFFKILGIGMFFYVATIATASVRHDYYQTLTIPVISLILGSGSIYLWNLKEFNSFLRKGVLIFSIVMMLGMATYQVKEFYKINHPEIFKAGQAVDRLVPKDAWVIAPYNGDTAFLYQTKRFGWPVVERGIDEMIRLGAKYFVSVNFDNDTNDLLKKYKTTEKTKDYIIIDLQKPL